MVSVFMISGFRRPFGPALVATLSIIAASCQKVPLLAPSGSSITLIASTTTLPLNGSTDLIAQVIEASGTPPQGGTQVAFTTTLGTIQPATAETDGNGRVSVKFVAGTASGTATITAFSGGAGGGTSSTGTGTTATTTTTNVVKIAVGAAAVASVSLTANPTTVSAAGGSSTMTASVRDGNGNVLGGVAVSFTADNGSFSAPVVFTDQNGNAQTILTTTRTAKVTATAGVASGTGTGATSGVQSQAVTINVNGGSTIVIGAISPAAPSVGQPVTFPLTYTTDATTGSPIQSVTVDYGDGSVQKYLGKQSSVTHTYNVVGSYAMRATETDASGDTSSASTSVIVAARPQPVVSVTAPTTAPTVGTDATFTASITPAANTVLQDATIDFGEPGVAPTDLGAATGSFAVHHVYQTGGTFTVRLTATDSNGGVGAGTTTVFVQPATPLGVTLTASATTGTTNTIETFTATVTGLGNAVVTSYLWEFGNGDAPQSTTTNQITHSYSHPSGPFTAKVTVTTSSNSTASNTTVISP
jgi:hypothetical protein